MADSIATNRHGSNPHFLSGCITWFGFFRPARHEMQPESRPVETAAAQPVSPDKPECGGYNEAFVLERWAHYECPEDLLR